MNKCSKCGRPVASHAALGSVHGPNCTLPPLTPKTPKTPEALTKETTGETVTSAPSTSQPAPGPSSSAATLAVSSSAPVSTSAAAPVSEAGQVTLTNAQLEAHLVDTAGSLQQQIEEIESEMQQDRYDSIMRLQSNVDDLQVRLQALQTYKSQRLRAMDPLNSIQAAFVACRPPPVAPHTSVTWSHPLQLSMNPSIAPGSARPASFAAYSQSSLTAQTPLGLQQHVSAGIPSNPRLHLASATGSEGISAATQRPPAPGQPATQGAAGFSATSFQNPASLPGDSAASNRFGQSAPNLQASLAADLVTQFASALGQSLPALHHARGPQIVNQVEQDAAAMSANSTFLAPDQIISMNPIAKAVLSLPDDAREEREVLGKYIPELFARHPGKIEDIRSKMSYQEFMAMFLRMLVEMIKHDPALVPDRILFLSRIANKAAKYRWSDVRHCYICAMRDMRLKLRKWSDDLRDITEDELPPSTYQPGQNPAPGKRAATHNANSDHNKAPFPCRDWNDRECYRKVCKFDHKCYVCSQSHPAKACHYRPNNIANQPNTSSA